ncbi:MAG: SRPBCC family protein [Proteobacteria bacterium]|nr:SRPBCC family protein [Pseudomonadota bacterium]
MITVAMSTVIGADSDRVWRALTLPGELAAWDERIVAPVDDAANYPSPGRELRWRYRLGNVPTILSETPREVCPTERLRTRLCIGTLRFDQTYTLQPEMGPETRTRLSVKIVASNTVAVIGTVIDRFEVRRRAVDHVDQTLRSLQKWCENTH